jgi:hypothetical protein
MHLLQHDYIDFLSVALICLGVCNPGEAAEKPLRSRVERVASYLFHNLTLTFGGIEAKEVLHGGKVGGLHVFSREPSPVQRLRRGQEVPSGEHPFLSLRSAS